MTQQKSYDSGGYRCDYGEPLPLAPFCDALRSDRRQTFSKNIGVIHGFHLLNLLEIVSPQLKIKWKSVWDIKRKLLYASFPKYWDPNIDPKINNDPYYWGPAKNGPLISGNHPTYLQP